MALRTPSFTSRITASGPPGEASGSAGEGRRKSGERRTFQAFLHKSFASVPGFYAKGTTLLYPQVLAPKDLTYNNLFRVLIVQFIDASSFDLRSIRKTCIHIAHPDAKRLIPFDTFNMFYRDDLEQSRLAPPSPGCDGSPLRKRVRIRVRSRSTKAVTVSALG